MKTLIASANLPPRVIATITGLLTFGCATVCIAGDNGDMPHAVVRFGDLNVSSPDGAAALYHRIYTAAYEVCGTVDTDRRYLPDPLGLHTCVHHSVRNAVAKVNQPALSAIYNTRNHDPLPITVAAAQNR